MMRQQCGNKWMLHYVHEHFARFKFLQLCITLLSSSSYLLIYDQIHPNRID